MRRWFMPWFTISLAALAGCTGASSTSPSGAAVFAELDSLPVGLEVIHSPNNVSAPVGPLDEGWQFRWDFRTEVRAIDRPLTVVYFGIAAWNGKKWILPANTQLYNSGVLRQSDFIEWYHCPGARIAPGKPAVDPENWAGSRTRTSFRQKWFFIAEDDRKKRYKGEAVVELLDSE
jgi:hypothetical protein